jgi:hypothetical protein
MLDLMFQQRLYHRLLVAKLMHQAAFADAALARDGVQCQPARAVARDDGERRLNNGVSGFFRSRGIVHVSICKTLGEGEYAHTGIR